MTTGDQRKSNEDTTCVCFSAPARSLVIVKELGVDGIFAEVSLLTCPLCGQHWLRYFYEMEAFTASGRWYLGAIQVEQASRLTVENARSTLEGLSWYFYGGSYYEGKSGRAAGKILSIFIVGLGLLVVGGYLGWAA